MAVCQERRVRVCVCVWERRAGVPSIVDSIPTYLTPKSEASVNTEGTMMYRKKVFVMYTKSIKMKRAVQPGEYSENVNFYGISSNAKKKKNGSAIHCHSRNIH